MTDTALVPAAPTQPAPPDTSPLPPGAAKVSPFQLLAYILFRVRHSLEDPGQGGKPPRWVRVARGNVAKDGFIGKGVSAVVKGFVESLTYMVKLTLDIQELLIQTDAAKALVETSADLVKAVVSDDFRHGVAVMLGGSATDDPLGGAAHDVDAAMDKVKDILGYIPDPDDVYVLGRELYRMLAIVQEPAQPPPGPPLQPGDEVQVPPTGKVRLMQWAYEDSVTLRDLGPRNNPRSDTLPVTRLGTRRLSQVTNDKLPKESGGIYHDNFVNQDDSVFQFYYDARETDANKQVQDLVELHDALIKLGYADPPVTDDDKKTFSAKTGQLLSKFQMVNSLPVTGALDNDTLNRLYHLDFRAWNVRRALPFDPAKVPPQVITDIQSGILPLSSYFKLINPGADTPQEEGVDFVQHPSAPFYQYYQVGVVASRADKGHKGWVRDFEADDSPGFVALRSRNFHEDVTNRTPGSFDGGDISEGEAQGGGYFFAARFTEPWRAGRNGQPGAGALATNVPKSGTRSWIYQWIDLSQIPNRDKAKAASYDLRLTASVWVRALYQEAPDGTFTADRGRIFIESYPELGTVRDPDLVKLSPDPEKPGSGDRSAWSRQYPQPSEVKLAKKEPAVTTKEKHYWVQLVTAQLTVAANAGAALVVLEGMHADNWDTDAYFDTVEVRWEFVKKP